jgi:hypothetical protein
MSTPLPDWLAQWLGVESGRGEGAVWRIEYSWDWAPWVTLTFAIVAVLFVAAIYARENPQASRMLRCLLAVIRLAVVAVVLVMLAQVAISLERTGLPYVAVVVDDSLSMTVVDRYAEPLVARIQSRLQPPSKEPSRWALARSLLLENDGRLLQRLARSYRLRLYFLSNQSAGARPAGASDSAGLIEEIRTLEPEMEATRLGAAIDMVLNDLRGTAPAALVLLTDGITTEGQSLADAALHARRRGVPIFAVGIGDDKPQPDLKLSDLVVEEIVFVNDVVNFEARLNATGFAGREARVTLRRKDQSKILAETTVKVPPDGQSLSVRLPYRPTEEGEHRFVLEVKPVAGELDTNNNRQERAVRVRKEQIRVLLVQGYPSFEFRYLQNMLRRDATIKLETLLQEADPEYAQEGGASLHTFPVRKDDLFQYDVLILGDVDPSQLTETMLQNVVAFVEERGGSLIAIAGPRFMPLGFRNTPLARLFPVKVESVSPPEGAADLQDGFPLQLTELGKASPQMQLGASPAETEQIWQKLPPLYWMLEAPELKLAARVLAEHPARVGRDGRPLPLIVLQYVGAGKVLLHLTDETWRWRYRIGDTYFARYWVQTIRYLARSKLFEGDRAAILTSDRREYRRGEPVRLRVRFTDESTAPAEDDGVTVVVEQKGHTSQRITLHRRSAERGIFEATLDHPATGAYHAWIAAPALEGRTPFADFTVAAPPGEFQQVEMNAVELKQAAELTKGRFYSFLAAHRLLEDLPVGHQVPVESLPPRPLWNTWPVLLLPLVLLIAEWIIRKRAGMT